MSYRLKLTAVVMLHGVIFSAGCRDMATSDLATVTSQLKKVYKYTGTYTVDLEDQALDDLPDCRSAQCLADLHWYVETPLFTEYLTGGTKVSGASLSGLTLRYKAEFLSREVFDADLIVARFGSKTVIELKSKYPSCFDKDKNTSKQKAPWRKELDLLDFDLCADQEKKAFTQTLKRIELTRTEVASNAAARPDLDALTSDGELSVVLIETPNEDVANTGDYAFARVFVPLKKELPELMGASASRPSSGEAGRTSQANI